MAKTKLSELAGTDRLTGPVCVTDSKGMTHTYADEDAAAAAWSGKRLEHRRGAFFEMAGPAPAPAPKVEAEAESKKSSRRSRKRQSDD